MPFRKVTFMWSVNNKVTVQNKISLAFNLAVETNKSLGDQGPITYLHILCGLLLVGVKRTYAQQI
jgi:hypothetical protein